MTRRDAGPRLGRGLAALLGETDETQAPTPQAGSRSLPIDLIASGPFQPRGAIEPASLAELVDSIRTHGVLQPILVRPHPQTPQMYQIIAGERRWRAVQQLGLHDIPAFVRELTDDAAMAAALVENLQRQDLNPIEEAEGYRRLIEEFRLTQDALGEAVGKSRSHVANTLRLLNLPHSVQVEVRNGALSAGHARALLAHPEPSKAALAVIAGGLSVRQTEALAARRGPNGATVERASRDPDLLALERDLTARLGMRVQIAAHGPSGTVRISFRSLDQLDGIVRLLAPA